MSHREREFGGVWKGEAERYIEPVEEPIRAAPVQVQQVIQPPQFPGIPSIFQTIQPVQPKPTLTAMKAAFGAKRGDPRYKEYLDIDKSGVIDIYDVERIQSQETAREVLQLQYGIETPEEMDITGFRKEKVGEPTWMSGGVYGPTPVQVQKYQYVVELKPAKPAPGLAESILKFDPYKFGAQIGAGLREILTGEVTPPHKIAGAAKTTGQVFAGVGIGGARLDRPQDFLAGFVAVPESLVYTVGRFAGFETPTPPPTLGSALVTTGVGAFVTGQFAPSPELKELERLGPGYIAGSLAGEIGLSWLIGKGAAKGFTIIKKVTPTIVKTQVGKLGTQFGKAVGKLADPLTRRMSYAKYRASGWLAEHSAWYKARMVKALKYKPHIVGATPPTEPSLIKEPFVMGKVQEQLRAGQFFWGEKTYGMGEIWVSARPSVDVARRVSTWVKATQVVSGVVHTPYAITYGKQLERGGLFQQIIVPTQLDYPVTLKTEFLPFIPSVLPSVGKGQLFIFGPTFFGKQYAAPTRTHTIKSMFERVVSPPAPPKVSPVKYPPIVTTPFQLPVQPPPVIQKPDPVTPFAPPIQIFEPGVRTKTFLKEKYGAATEQVSRLKQREELIEFPREEYRFAPPPTFIRTPAPPRKKRFPFQPPRPRKKRKPVKGKGFLWGYREHPIREPEEMVKGLMKRFKQ